MNRSFSTHPDILFFWLALAGYGLAFLLYIAYLASERRKTSSVAMGFMGFALLMQTIAIVLRSVSSGHLPLTNMYEYLGVFAWFASIFYFITLKLYKQQIIGAFISPVVFMLMVSASLLPKEASMKLIPALQSYWLPIHVSLAVLGEAAFAVGFAANIMYLLKKWLPATSVLGGRLPVLDQIDRVSYKAVTIGYPLFTVGALFAGAIWAEHAWGSFWSWDPKEVGSLVVWLVYTAYLHARLVRGWTGTRAVVISSIGFVCTLLTLFANFILGGLHSYG